METLVICNLGLGVKDESNEREGQRGPRIPAPSAAITVSGRRAVTVTCLCSPGEPYERIRLFLWKRHTRQHAVTSGHFLSADQGGNLIRFYLL